MKKVILNGCFGGYSWSRQGIVEYLKEVNRHEQIDVRYTKQFCKWNGSKYHRGEIEYITPEEYVEIDRHASYDGGYYEVGVTVNGYGFWDRGIERTDEYAITVLEKYGTEFCSGDCASLYIDEYDDENYDWHIAEYDGSEDLEMIPVVNPEKIDACKNTEEILDYLESIDIKIRGRYYRWQGENREKMNEQYSADFYF